jgi:hypothetical protein
MQEDVCKLYPNIMSFYIRDLRIIDFAIHGGQGTNPWYRYMPVNDSVCGCMTYIYVYMYICI